MVFGLDDALAVVGLSFTCLHGCVESLAVLSKATHYNQDLSNVGLQFELELHKLFAWAEAVGLMQAPPILRVDTKDAMLVNEILSQLDGLLSDHQRLKKRYGLHLTPTPDDVTTLDNTSSTFNKLGSKPHAAVKKVQESIFAKRKHPWKVLRWVAYDEKQAKKLLKDIEAYVTNLQKFLENARQTELRRDFDAVLREAILALNDEQKLDIIGEEYEHASSKTAIVSAVRLKQMGLRLGLLGALHPSPFRETLTSPRFVTTIDSDAFSRLALPSTHLPGSLDSMRLSIGQLTMLRAARAQRLRTFTYYDKKAVLLEWKYGFNPSEPVLEKRVDQVAAFLHRLDPQFHSLPCRGYVRDYEADRYGYIFDLPEDFQPQSLKIKELYGSAAFPPLPELRSLRQFFNESNSTPSLNERLSVALVLLETLRNLHTSGWLHKELRSDNIIFVRSARSEAGNSLELSSYSVFVAGYVFARADDPGEMTEPLEPDIEADLYRHPASLGRSRRSFCKSFDIFSVGCTLIEIGLWSSLRTLLERYCDPPSPSTVEGQLYRASSANSVLSLQTTKSREADNLAKNLRIRSMKDYNNYGASQNLLQLRKELLLSRIPSQEDRGTERSVSKGYQMRHAPGTILQILAAATGNAYTKVVEDFLSMDLASSIDSRDSGAEHEEALEVETKALSAIQTVANAI